MPNKQANIKHEDTSEKFELTIEGRLENLAIVGEFIAKTVQYYQIESKALYAVQLSVDEACTNIIEHGYSITGKIVIRCALLDKQFIVNIMDWGEPFDPTNTPSPDIKSALNERKAGGLGIYFIKEYMDKVSYTRVNGMNQLTIVKYIKTKN